MNVEKIYRKALKQYEAKNYDEALKLLADLKKLAPDYKEAYYMETFIWHALGKIDKEISVLKKILSKFDISSPRDKELVAQSLINVGFELGNLQLNEKALKFYHRAAQLHAGETYFAAISNSLMTMNGMENASADSFRALYDEYKKNLADIKPYPKKFYEHKKIRVGFMSSDFRQHPVINQSWTLLTKLDKNLFDTYFYSNVKNPDVVTEYLRKTAGTWRDIYDLTDEVAAKLIRDDEIDILFDMNGHTLNDRLRVAAYRPASVQMSGIGYMNSTGLECFDYFLSDETCAGDESFFTEKVLRLPHSLVCYEPSTKLEPAAEPPCLKNKFVTFGSFNQFRKITDAMLSAWKKILDAVPNSRLILKDTLFSTVDGKNFVGNKLKSFGFDLNRVEMRPRTPTYLVEYGDMDIALDTFPYNGGVTTCEALYMGVPVVSLYGNRHGARVGLSFLKNIGLEELAVDSYEKYVERAVGLAGDWELLTILRRNLRTMMKNSPLMDSTNYLREIQAAFVKILDEQKNFWGNANGKDSSGTLLGGV